MKDVNKDDFIDQRDLVRILDEQREAARRRNVMSGKWTEEESEKKMKEVDAEGARMAPLYDNDQSLKNDFMEFYMFFKNIHDKIIHPLNFLCFNDRIKILNLINYLNKEKTFYNFINS